MADIIQFPGKALKEDEDHANMEALFKILHGKIGKVVIIAEFLDGNGFVGSYPHEIDESDSEELYRLIEEIVFDAEYYN